MTAATRKGRGAAEKGKPSAPAKTSAPDAERRLRFVDEYMIDLNATQAAVRAGYSEKTAKQIGSRLLTRVDVRAGIEAKRKELAHQSGITRERVLAEMAKLAFSDLRQLFTESGSLKPVKDWPEGAAGAVAAIETDEIRAEGVAIGLTRKVKLWDKGKQLENLLKHLGMAEDKTADPVPAIDRMAANFDAFRAKLEKLAAA